VNGAAPEPLPPPIPGSEPAPSPVLHQDHGSDLPGGTARVLLDASLASLIGGLAFIVTVWPQGASFASTRLLLWAAALVAALTSLDLAVIQHASAEGLSLVSALGPSHLLQSLQFRFGRIAAARLVLLTLAAALTTRLSRGGALTARSARWCAAATAVAIGLFETVVLLGHDGRSGALAEGARLVHTLGVSVWLGGLVMLFVVVLPRRSTEELLAVLPRFSALATAAVVSLLVGGVVLSIELVGAANALPTTSYGRVLVLKLVVVAVLLVAASRSRDVVRRRLVRASSRRVRLAAAGPIATWVGIELALMTVVLALTALLVSSTPPA
jgi:putative copper export protein